MAAEIPHLSPSIAHVLLRKSPWHAWQRHRLGGDVRDEPTEATRRGSLFDRLLFGTGPNIVVVDAKDWRTKAAQEARDAAEAAGQYAVLIEKLKEQTATVTSVKQRLAEAGVLLSGNSQVTQVWESGGVPCKGKLDHLILGADDSALIYDVKTCEDACTEKLARSCVTYGYDVQHAAYVEGVTANNPEMAGRVKMQFIFVELADRMEPQIRVKSLAGSMRSLGEAKWARAKAQWGACLQTNRFPGYSDDGPIEATPWQMAEAMTEGGSQEAPF